MEQLLHFALEAGHKAEEIPFAMTLDNLVDLVDRYPEILGQFNVIMASQMTDLTGKIQGSAATLVTDGPSLKSSDSKTSV